MNLQSKWPNILSKKRTSIIVVILIFFLWILTRDEETGGTALIEPVAGKFPAGNKGKPKQESPVLRAQRSAAKQVESKMNSSTEQIPELDIRGFLQGLHVDESAIRKFLLTSEEQKALGAILEAFDERQRGRELSKFDSMEEHKIIKIRIPSDMPASSATYQEFKKAVADVLGEKRGDAYLVHIWQALAAHNGAFGKFERLVEITSRKAARLAGDKDWVFEIFTYDARQPKPLESIHGKELPNLPGFYSSASFESDDTPKSFSHLMESAGKAN